MEKDKEKTRVMFIYPRYPDGRREVLALFPDLKGEGTDKDGTAYIRAYAHVGGHVEVPDYFLKRTRAAAAQYAPLAEELKSGHGYNLDIVGVKKVGRAHRMTPCPACGKRFRSSADQMRHIRNVPAYCPAVKITP